jgi:hypothetical protein
MFKFQKWKFSGSRNPNFGVTVIMKEEREKEKRRTVPLFHCPERRITLSFLRLYSAVVKDEIDPGIDVFEYFPPSQCCGVWH